MTPEEACCIVARHCLARLAEDAGEEWGYYGEIGEHDWSRVAEHVEGMAPPCPSTDEYFNAMALLESRAEQ